MSIDGVTHTGFVHQALARQLASGLAVPPDHSAPLSPKSASNPESLTDKSTNADSPRGIHELTPEEQKEVRELQERDREVRAHEQAHKRAAGQLATGGPTYEYTQGPDGRRYAIGGEVQIRIPEGNTPEETARIARQAQRAALAPTSPSSQDRAVAARAAQKARQAELEQASASEETGETDDARLPSVPGSQLRAYQQAASQPVRGFGQEDDSVASTSLLA